MHACTRCNRSPFSISTMNYEHKWVDFCKLGMTELFGQQYRAIVSNHVNRVVESLQVELATSLMEIPPMTRVLRCS